MEIPENEAARVSIRGITTLSIRGITTLSTTGNNATTKWIQSVVYEDKFSKEEDVSRHILQQLECTIVLSQD